MYSIFIYIFTCFNPIGLRWAIYLTYNLTGGVFCRLFNTLRVSSSIACQSVVFCANIFVDVFSMCHARLHTRAHLHALRGKRAKEVKRSSSRVLQSSSITELSRSGLSTKRRTDILTRIARPLRPHLYRYPHGHSLRI